MCRKYVGLLFVTFFLVFSVTAQQQSIKLVTWEYPPYIIKDGDSAKGLTIEIVNEVFKRIEQPISIEFVPTARAINMVTNGSADGSFTLKKTPERENSLLFPNETIIGQDYVFFVQIDSKVEYTGEFSSLSKATIGVLNQASFGQVFDAAAKNGEFGKLDIASDYYTLFRKLLIGRNDAIICSKLVGIAILKELGGIDKVKISGPPTESAFSYLVFTKVKDLTAVAKAFDKALATMKEDGTYDKIINKYK
jgi:polar amino acid transport system substrate-binding protein